MFTTLVGAYFMLFKGLCLAGVSHYRNLLAMVWLSTILLSFLCLCFSPDRVHSTLMFGWCWEASTGHGAAAVQAVQGCMWLEGVKLDSESNVWFGVYHSHSLFTLTLLLNSNCHPNSSAKNRLWKCPQNYLNLIESTGVGTVIFIFILFSSLLKWIDLDLTTSAFSTLMVSEQVL